MIGFLIGIPVFGGCASFLIRSDRWRRWWLLLVAGLHGILTVGAWRVRPQPVFGGWLALDDPGLLFLGITSILFFAAAIYGVGFLKREEHGDLRDYEEGFFYFNAPEAVFTACLLFFLGSMTLVVTSQHFGMLWVAIEATTLSSAPLIYFHRHHRSLEAAWKYLLICSVGIALALFGNFFLAVAASNPKAGSVPLILTDLIGQASRLHGLWLKAAFIFFLVGYGTKMGLAPLHTWLPDAHSESPSVVSALLSGALLNCAFLGIFRIHQVSVAAGVGAFSSRHLVLFGLLSMGVAAVFILGQSDFKRLLAYSSVEHMGILALGIGLGPAGTFGSMLHAVNHSFAKALLFLVAGNIVGAYKTKSASHVHGILKLMPQSGLLWMAGFLAISGFPPFGLFISEIAILKAAVESRQLLVAALYLIFLAVIFMGMAAVMLSMAQGESPADLKRAGSKEPASTLFSPAFLGLLVLMMGMAIPPFLNDALLRIASGLGGH